MTWKRSKLWIGTTGRITSWMVSTIEVADRNLHEDHAGQQGDRCLLADEEGE